MVNGENGVCGAKCEECLPHIKSNMSCFVYVEPTGVFVKFTKYNLVIHGSSHL